MLTIRGLRWNSKKSNFLIFIHYIFLNKKIMIFSKQNLYKLKKMLLSLSEVTTKEGVVLITDGDMEVGLEVFVDGDAGLEPAPDGEYTVDNNIVVVEGGKIVEIKEKPLEQPIEEPVVETPMENMEKPMENPIDNPEEPIEPSTEPMEPSIEELKNLVEEQKTMIENLKSENETLKAEIEDLKKKLEEPLSEPAEEEFKNQKPTEKETKIDFSKYIKRK